MAQADGEMGFGLYSKIPVVMLESAACRTLSAGAFRVLVDFRVEWDKATRYGTRECAGITFTWTSCRWPVCRETWNGYRGELVARGFLSCMNELAGQYRWSAAWESHAPAAKELAKLRQDEQRKQKRAAETIGYRKNQPPVEEVDTPVAPPVERNDPAPRDENVDTSLGREIQPIEIIDNNNNTPLNPPLGDGECLETPTNEFVGATVSGVGATVPPVDATHPPRSPRMRGEGGGADLKSMLERLAKVALATRADETFEEDGVRYAMQCDERVQVWPMPRAPRSVDLLAWARKADPWLTPEQRSRVVERLDKMEAVERERQREFDLHPADVFLKEADGADAATLGQLVARYLDDETAANRITRQIQHAGADTVKKAAADIIRHPHGIKSKVGLLLTKTANAA